MFKESHMKEDKGITDPERTTLSLDVDRVNNSFNVAEDLPKNEFLKKVYPVEMEEIIARRKNHKDLDSKIEINKERLTTNNNIVGVCCSGGGIRSASFCLGIFQRLIEMKLFHKVDYLSTVSGGGYIGSCISSLARNNVDNVKLLIDRSGYSEPEALSHIRNHSEYLRTNSLMAELQIPALFVEGVLRTLLNFFPLIIFLVFITEFIFEIVGPINEAVKHYAVLIGFIPLALSFLLRPMIKTRQNWNGRSNADDRFMVYICIALASFFIIPFLALQYAIADYNAARLVGAIFDLIGAHKLFVSVCVVVSISLSIIFYIRLGIAVVFWIIGAISSAIILITYILLCVETINSPYAFIENGDSKFYETIEKMRNYKEYGYKIYCLEESDSQNLKKYFSGKDINVDDYCIENFYDNNIQFIHKENHIGDADAFGKFLDFFINHFTTYDKSFLNVQYRLSNNTNQALIIIAELKLFNGYTEWWIYLLGLIVFAFNFISGNINQFSLHTFYRDNLVKTFLLERTSEGITVNDDLKLSELCSTRSGAPYQIINTSLNLHGSRNPHVRSRRATSFILSKRFCGCAYTGYCDTKALEEVDPHLNLGTAMAISAAAASPNMGSATIKSLRFLMTLLNIRLSYWLPNPKFLINDEARKKFKYRRLGLSYLLREAFGLINEKTAYVNCSDGGHIENLGIYELLRRQCKTIICIDAEADPKYACGGLAILQRYAQIDLGVSIDLDISEIKPLSDHSPTNFAIGIVNYLNGDKGKIIYLKLSYTGHEPGYVRNYKSLHPNYPHDSTGDQFFDETQFEVYRALGSYVATCASLEIESALG